MTKEEKEHYEKYNVAFHEMGHAHIMRRFGAGCNPILWKNPLTNLDNDEKSWLGTTIIFTGTGQVKYEPSMTVVPAPLNWKVLLGLAGLVAEHMHRGEDSARKIVSYIKEVLDYDEISDSDRGMIGDNWTEADVQEVMDIFTEEWDILKADAERLILFYS